VLLKIGVLVEVEEEELEKEHSYIDEVTWEIEEKINEALEITDDESDFGWRYTSITVLDENEHNYGKCSKCGTLTSDKEKEGFIPEIGTGATVNKKLLCDDCLPKDHPLAF
jgi:hypothetical protein